MGERATCLWENIPETANPPVFSPPVSLKLRDQHPQAHTRWFRQQQQPNVQGDELPKCLFLWRDGSWQGDALAGAAALELPYEALVGNHLPLVLLLCSQPTSHTPTPCSQRHLGSLCCARNAIPSLLPSFPGRGSSFPALVGARHQPKHSLPPLIHRLFQVPSGWCVGISLLKHWIL